MSPDDAEQLLNWAVGRWNAEVRDRPRCNVYRPILDATWRQVIEHAGGNPDEILGYERQIEVETDCT